MRAVLTKANARCIVRLENWQAAAQIGAQAVGSLHIDEVRKHSGCNFTPTNWEELKDVIRSKGCMPNLPPGQPTIYNSSLIAGFVRSVNSSTSCGSSKCHRSKVKGRHSCSKRQARATPAKPMQLQQRLHTWLQQAECIASAHLVR